MYVKSSVVFLAVIGPVRLLDLMSASETSLPPSGVSIAILCGYPMVILIQRYFDRGYPILLHPDYMSRALPNLMMSSTNGLST